MVQSSAPAPNKPQLSQEPVSLLCAVSKQPQAHCSTEVEGTPTHSSIRSRAPLGVGCTQACSLLQMLLLGTIVTGRGCGGQRWTRWYLQWSSCRADLLLAGPEEAADSKVLHAHHDSSPEARF